MTQSPVTRRSGLTLVEILIAMVMTLIVLFAMMEAFKYASGEMQRSRAVIEMSSQLRGAQELLRSDLEHMTLDPKPWTQTALPKGYFEYVESAGTDKDPYLPGVHLPGTGPRKNNPTSNGVAYSDTYLGDIDDVLAFTANRPEQRFRGRVAGEVKVSPMAEIIWWTQWADRPEPGEGQTKDVDFDESVALCRRVLLIRPDLNNPQGHLGVSTTNTDFLKSNDLSVRAEGGFWVANRLEDLGHRANRFARENSAPFCLDPNKLNQVYRMSDANGPTGDDIVLTNLAGFDIKVYSPTARIDDQTMANSLLQPGDAGYQPNEINPLAVYSAGKGAFVDLNWSRYQPDSLNWGWFAGPPHPDSGLNAVTAAYDTWTPLYEVGGQATDGIDNDGVNGVDDPGERSTMPPYSHPIRGLKVSFRLVEKNTKQVRQASVIHSFVPE